MKRPEAVPLSRGLGNHALRVCALRCAGSVSRPGPRCLHRPASSPPLRHARSRSLSTSLPAIPENAGVEDERGIRKWYYVVDCYKDKRFLDFFFKRLGPNTTPYHRGEYHWISPCGREVNFVYAEDTPVVFQDLTDDGLFYHTAPVRLRLPSSVPLPTDDEALRGPTRPDPGRASEADDQSKVLSAALLRSSLVLDRLDLTADGSSIIWKGKRYPIRMEHVKIR
ncbi:MAG: hypothetical protein BJ554DRAFT_8382 [Olpidium bornovanus]|uniref:Uncharacterized protein n=1 Tax=Olpidium bornovanus TaxID=278681 RepID=A0A8H8DIM8_9FUNG|nr:MAG: hypothetical protein BJ554DRAFT_8382 [Olpidium bornovanus]